MKRLAQGPDLSGDWAERLRFRVRAAGYTTVTQFAEENPAATLMQLIERVNDSDTDADPRPNTADHLAQLWKAEAIAGGDASIARFARRALVGEMHDMLPDGWPVDESEAATFPLSENWATWSGMVPDEYEENAFGVWRAIQTSSPPPGWLPRNADDPILATAFDNHWSRAAGT